MEDWPLWKIRIALNQVAPPDFSHVTHPLTQHTEEHYIKSEAMVMAKIICVFIDMENDEKREDEVNFYNFITFITFRNIADIIEAEISSRPIAKTLNLSAKFCFKCIFKNKPFKSLFSLPFPHR